MCGFRGLDCISMGFFLRRVASRLGFSARSHVASSATIDVAQAPPLAPVAPVDFHDHAQVSGVLNTAARIGEIVIAAGSTHSDAMRQVSAVMESFGVWGAHVDITHNRIRLFAQVGGSRVDPVTVVRVISSPPNDFHQLTITDQLIRDIHAGRVDLAAAQQRLDALAVSDPPMRLPGVLVCWAIMGAAVSVLLGGDVWVALLSMVAAAVIIGMSSLLTRWGLPVFFHNVLGGVFAALLAGVAYRVGIEFGVTLRPSMVIATSIIAMLAGLTLVQAIQNGVTFAPVTGNARFFDTVIITGGIVAGVGIGIELSAHLGFSLPPMETQPVPNFASATARVAGGAVASAAFARACLADWPSTLVSGVVSFLGSSLFYYVFLPAGVGSVSALALVAVFIGVSGGLIARRYLIPPLIVAIAGVTPLLPGLSIYRGMYGLLHEQILVGFSNLTVALATATALSAGVFFGEWWARRIRRPRGLGRYVRLATMMARRRGVFGPEDSPQVR